MITKIYSRYIPLRFLGLSIAGKTKVAIHDGADNEEKIGQCEGWVSRLTVCKGPWTPPV